MAMTITMAKIPIPACGCMSAQFCGRGPECLPLARSLSDLWGTKLKIGSTPRGCYLAPKSLRAFPVAVIEGKKRHVATSSADSSIPTVEAPEQLARQILSGEFSVESATPADTLSQLRRKLSMAGPPGRYLSYLLATWDRKWRLDNAVKMPEAWGDVAKIVGQPFFIPLYLLFQTYGGVFRLSFGPKSFVIVSDPVIAKRILKDNAKGYSKGILAEILEFVMGKGLIPADELTWKVRRRAIVPSFHRKFLTAMLLLFGQCSGTLCDKLCAAANTGEEVEMESLFSRMTLDVIGKAVFNYEFNSLSVDTGIVDAVNIALREAEARSTAVFPYWKIPVLAAIDPRQQKVKKALSLVNETLDTLIAKCRDIVDKEDIDFDEEYISDRDPSILHFLLAAGDEVTSKQLRDDLMTLLIAGHETSAAVLTWTFYLLALNPGVASRLQKEVDEVLGDRVPTIDDLKKLRYSTNVINESMRLYPQPPVLIRRALENDVLGKYPIRSGVDIFISTWNLHRSPYLWDEANEFRPDRWDTYSVEKASQDFKFLPFGGGPRKCVGDAFATFETVTALAMLLRRFDFKLAAGAPPVTMTTGATIHTANGLHMAISHRTKLPTVTGNAVQASESFTTDLQPSLLSQK